MEFPPPLPPVVLWPNIGRGFLILEVSRSHSVAFGRLISLSQRPLPDKMQHTQQKNIHASGGIRTRNLSLRAAADLQVL